MEKFAHINLKLLFLVLILWTSCINAQVKSTKSQLPSSASTRPSTKSQQASSSSSSGGKEDVIAIMKIGNKFYTYEPISGVVGKPTSKGMLYPVPEHILKTLNLPKAAFETKQESNEASVDIEKELQKLSVGPRKPSPPPAATARQQQQQQQQPKPQAVTYSSKEAPPKFSSSTSSVTTTGGYGRRIPASRQVQQPQQQITRRPTTTTTERVKITSITTTQAAEEDQFEAFQFDDEVLQQIPDSVAEKQGKGYSAAGRGNSIFTNLPVPTAGAAANSKLNLDDGSLGTNSQLFSAGIRNLYSARQKDSSRESIEILASNSFEIDDPSEHLERQPLLKSESDDEANKPQFDRFALFIPTKPTTPSTTATLEPEPEYIQEVSTERVVVAQRIHNTVPKVKSNLPKTTTRRPTTTRRTTTTEEPIIEEEQIDDEETPYQLEEPEKAQDLDFTPAPTTTRRTTTTRTTTARPEAPRAAPTSAEEAPPRTGGGGGGVILQRQQQQQQAPPAVQVSVPGPTVEQYHAIEDNIPTIDTQTQHLPQNQNEYENQIYAPLKSQLPFIPVFEAIQPGLQISAFSQHGTNQGSQIPAAPVSFFMTQQQQQAQPEQQLFDNNQLQHSMPQLIYVQPMAFYTPPMLAAAAPAPPPAAINLEPNQQLLETSPLFEQQQQQQLDYIGPISGSNDVIPSIPIATFSPPASSQAAVTQIPLGQVTPSYQTLTAGYAINEPEIITGRLRGRPNELDGLSFSDSINFAVKINAPAKGSSGLLRGGSSGSSVSAGGGSHYNKNQMMRTHPKVQEFQQQRALLQSQHHQFYANQKNHYQQSSTEAPVRTLGVGGPKLEMFTPNEAVRSHKQQSTSNSINTNTIINAPLPPPGPPTPLSNFLPPSPPSSSTSINTNPSAHNNILPDMNTNPSYSVPVHNANTESMQNMIRSYNIIKNFQRF